MNGNGVKLSFEGFKVFINDSMLLQAGYVGKCLGMKGYVDVNLSGCVVCMVGMFMRVVANGKYIGL